MEKRSSSRNDVFASLGAKENLWDEPPFELDTQAYQAFDGTFGGSVTGVFEVLTYVGGVSGGIVSVTASSRAALKFVKHLRTGHSMSIEEIGAAATSAIEQAFGQRVNKDPDRMRWDGSAYQASWDVGGWNYEVLIRDVKTCVPVVTRTAAVTT